MTFGPYTHEDGAECETLITYEFTAHRHGVELNSLPNFVHFDSATGVLSQVGTIEDEEEVLYTF